MKFFKFIPFWLFLTFFKFGGGLHYTMMAPLGEYAQPDRAKLMLKNGYAKGHEYIWMDKKL